MLIPLRTSGFLGGHPLLESISWILKYAIGLRILIAGMIMLLPPGKGPRFIVLGRCLREFPGKQATLRRLIPMPGTLKTISKVWEEAGSPPWETLVQSLPKE